MRIPTLYQATHLEEKDIKFKYLYSGYIVLVVGIIYSLYYGWLNMILVFIIFAVLMFMSVRWH